MELSTNDFIAVFGEELQAQHYDEMQAARDSEMEPLSSDERLAALGEESYANFEALRKAKRIKLEDLADSIGLTTKRLREGVMEGSQFPRKHGAFDAMCRLLGFEPSEARVKLGGIYEARARDERIEARMSANEKLQEMHAVYQSIVDPTKRSTAEFVIDTLWRQLNELADSQG